MACVTPDSVKGTWVFGGRMQSPVYFYERIWSVGVPVGKASGPASSFFPAELFVLSV